MRLFVGIELGAAAAAAIDTAIRPLRTRLDPLAPVLPIRWLPAANHHLTLVFIGETPAAQQRDVEAALDQSWPCAAFDLTFTGAGMFPPSGPPHVLWLGAGHGRDQLVLLHREASARLIAAGVSPDDRAYRPHLTIARLKRPAAVRRVDHDVAVARAGAAAVSAARTIVGRTEVSVAAGRIGAVTLFRSRLSAQGATYQAVMRVPLQP